MEVSLTIRRGLSTVSDIGPFMIETSLYVEKIRKFLNYNNDIINNKEYELPDSVAVLELRDVSFGYDKKKMILKNINMKINPLEKIALVGYNGAGKTTLIKLILRLYDPTEGVILLNGIDIRRYDLEEYRRYLGVVFQDYKLFAASIGQNVAMDIVDESERDNIEKALHRGGFGDKLNKLKDGINTNLTKEFKDDGTELSGGESQKLAISRTFYKNAHFA